MLERPLLILPTPGPKKRRKLSGWGFKAIKPTHRDLQAESIAKQIEHIRKLFIVGDPGSDVERVLVMESTAKIDDLRSASEKIEGMEWLVEADRSLDDGNLQNMQALQELYDDEAREKLTGYRLYLVSSNAQGAERLHRLWKKYQRGDDLDFGLSKFKELFECLINLRFWDMQDRLRDTGILKTWKQEEKNRWDDQDGSVPVRFEIELHFRDREADRERAIKMVADQLEGEGGRVGKEICMKDIRFHALKATLPSDSISQIISIRPEDWETSKSGDGFPLIFSNQSIRYFRPIGQQLVLPPSETETDEEITEGELPQVDPLRGEELNRPPVLALLDGAPLVGHKLLGSRIIINDPDEFEGEYEPSEQVHGTAMASLLCHGDIGERSIIRSLHRPIYVRPIMKPGVTGFDGRRHEMIPGDCFQEDLVERAVREMFDGNTHGEMSATHVRVINLSIGNSDQEYLNQLSPWARLLDWLAFRHQVLFIVSAGNYFQDTIKLPGSDMPVAKRLREHIDEEQRLRRLLSPAEAVNVLTVGALHGDASSVADESGDRIDLVGNSRAPAQYSRIGPGYMGSIKPDVFAHGGRLLYEDFRKGNVTFDSMAHLARPPGVRVAYPVSEWSESLKNTAYDRGTSHAAAIVSHGAGRILEMLADLRVENPDMQPDFDAVLTKALLVHSTSWNDAIKADYEQLPGSRDKHSQQRRRYLSRYLGYGNIDIDRVLGCEGHRVTAIGCGRIRKDQSHHYELPFSDIDLPGGDYMRLIVTLAWFTPVNPQHVGWRKAGLRFEFSKASNGILKRSARSYDWQQVKMGTVQHEVFENRRKRRTRFDNMKVEVDCAERARSLDEDVPYGIAFTLEIAPPEQAGDRSLLQEADLYQQVKERLRQPVTPTVASR